MAMENLVIHSRRMCLVDRSILMSVLLGFDTKYNTRHLISKPFHIFLELVHPLFHLLHKDIHVAPQICLEKINFVLQCKVTLLYIFDLLVHLTQAFFHLVEPLVHLVKALIHLVKALIYLIETYNGTVFAGPNFLAHDKTDCREQFLVYHTRYFLPPRECLLNTQLH